MVSRHLVAAVERKSLSDLASSLLNGKLSYQPAELQVTFPTLKVAQEYTYRHLAAAHFADNCRNGFLGASQANQ